MFKFSKTLICNTKNNKIIHNITTFNKYLTSTVEVRKVQNTQSESNESNDYSNNTTPSKVSSQTVNRATNSASNNMVAAAFASLKINEPLKSNNIPTPQTDQRLATATNVNDLLSISSGSGVSRRHALQVLGLMLLDETSLLLLFIVRLCPY